MEKKRRCYIYFVKLHWSLQLVVSKDIQVAKLRASQVKIDCKSCFMKHVFWLFTLALSGKHLAAPRSSQFALKGAKCIEFEFEFHATYCICLRQP